MTEKRKTGFDKFFDAQMKSPSVSKEYAKARAEIDAIDTFMRTLDALREKQSLSKASLAKKMETSDAVVRRLLTSRNANPTLETVMKMAEVLGYRVELVRAPKNAATKSRKRAA